MRHLAKREYLGSMQDLFGDDVPQDILPDDVSGGFDTNGSEQFFSLKQYENFYKAGRELVQRNVLSLVSPLPKPTPPATRMLMLVSNSPVRMLILDD